MDFIVDWLKNTIVVSGCLLAILIVMICISCIGAWLVCTVGVVYASIIGVVVMMLVFSLMLTLGDS